jgi:Fe-S-cluster containining protein
MRCDPGCGECCGPVMCNVTEIRQIMVYIAEHQITPIRQGITCPFCQQGLCAIYPVRPYICRIFGHSPRLVCKRGYNVNLPQRKLQKLDLRYARTAKPDCWLHSFVYSDEEMLVELKHYFEEGQ